MSLAAAGRATLVLTGGAVLIQVIGFFRQMFLAAEMGIDSDLDALFVTLAVPMALSGVIAGGVGTAMVPAYVQAKEDVGPAAARRLVGTVLVWISLASVVLSLGLWVYADAIVAIVAPGLADAGTADAAAGYLRAFAPLTLVSSVSALLYATCQAERMFPTMTVASVAGPFLALAFMVYLWDALGLDGLVVGTLVGEFVTLGIFLTAVAVRHVAPLPHLVSRGLGLRALANHAAPLTLSRALVQVQGVVDRAVASLLLAGGVSALRYGDSLVRLPIGAIRPAYNAATYPTLVQANRGASLGDATERLIRYGLVFFVPLAGLTIALAPLATAIFYDRGSFSEADLALTAQVVAVSAPVIVTWTVQPAMVSALNAQRNGIVLLGGGILAAGINIVLDVLLGQLLGVIGVPLATVIASVIVILYMGERLSRSEPTMSTRLIWRTFFRASFAILPSAVVFGLPVWAGFIGESFAERVVVLVVAGFVGLSSYYWIARFLGLRESEAIMAFGTNTLRRVWPRRLWPH
jgi:putative peptidoglycan lipid II flippase